MLQLLGRLGMLMLTLLMWREVQPMGFVTNYCLHPGLQALLAFLSRREALIPPLGQWRFWVILT